MAKIICIEDSVDIQNLLNLSLGKVHDLSFVSTVKEGIKKLSTETYDLMLLDLSLPDGDGLTICNEVKMSTKPTPIIVLSAKNSVSDKVMGLMTGADDYLVKPFDTRELKARIESVLRRIPQSSVLEKVQVGELTIDKNRQSVVGPKGSVNLTPIEFRILTALTDHVDQVIPREDLYDRLWGNDTFVKARNIDTHVSKLRKKLEEFNYSILSKRGEGYKLTLNKSVNG